MVACGLFVLVVCIYTQVDLYPTLSELAGLSLPSGAGGAKLGGVSLVPAMATPHAPWPVVAPPRPRSLPLPTLKSL